MIDQNGGMVLVVFESAKIRLIRVIRVPSPPEFRWFKFTLEV